MTDVLQQYIDLVNKVADVFDMVSDNGIIISATVPPSLMRDLNNRYTKAMLSQNDYGPSGEVAAKLGVLSGAMTRALQQIAPDYPTAVGVGGEFAEAYRMGEEFGNAINKKLAGDDAGFNHDMARIMSGLVAAVAVAAIGAAFFPGASMVAAIGAVMAGYEIGKLIFDFAWPALERIFGDPLVLDLNGDGVHLIGLDGSHVNFDFGADGFRERTGWASAGDGFLARDLDGNGKIESLSEMFGTTTQDAFTMLRGFDIDGDGKITSADAVWSTLKVWQDANSNGITDAGELKTLADLGITEIGLGNTAVDRRVDGNYIHSAASFVMKGQTNEAQAVFFGMAPNIAIFTPPAGFVPNAEAANLPQLAGGGATPSLSRACTPQRKLGVGNRLAA